MKLLNNSYEAIAFSAQDYLGNEVKLSDYKGQKILLGFVRGTHCPFCVARVKKLLKKHEELKSKGIQTIMVIAADKEVIKKNSKNNSSPFPIIADPDQVIFEKYGLYNSKFVVLKTMVRPLQMMWTMMTNRLSFAMMKESPILPGEFLINENFRIDIAHYGKHLCDHIPLEQILEK